MDYDCRVMTSKGGGGKIIFSDGGGVENSTEKSIKKSKKPIDKKA